jgi:hypothetical protein
MTEYPGRHAMKLFCAIVVSLILLAFAPVVAIAALVLLPVVWLLSIPFRLVSIIVEAILATVRGVLFLPARILGIKPAT